MANDITRLRRIAARCDLTQTPSQAVQDLRQLAVTVMCVSQYEDVEEFIEILGEDFLRKTLRETPAICFEEKAWIYWHLRLYGCDTVVPEVPRRVLS